MDPYKVLGLDQSASESDLRAAWKRLAINEHPDVGGSHERMIELNQALHLCLGNLQKPMPKVVNRNKKTERTLRRRIQEMSSFTVSVLPVECWLALEVVAAQCGPLISSEPPYVLEFFLQDSHLEHSLHSWCRCDLMPEAGATTVHITIGSAREDETPDIEQVRDFLVRLLNELDWPEP